MKRWNDFYDKMDPHKKDPKKNAPIDVTRSASVKYFSVYPRKTVHHNNPESTGNHSKTSHNHQNQHQPQHQSQPSAETSFQGERYISRQNEFGTVSNRVDAGNINYAWVD